VFDPNARTIVYDRPPRRLASDSKRSSTTPPTVSRHADGPKRR
jgi:hypothetical protein